jgi:hypothetical protein
MFPFAGYAVHVLVGIQHGSFLTSALDERGWSAPFPDSNFGKISQLRIEYKETV